MTEKVVAEFKPNLDKYFRVEYLSTTDTYWLVDSTTLNKDTALYKARALADKYGTESRVVEVTND
jgi:hypothetical protein